MQLTCTSKMIKYLLIIFNFLFVVTGIILIAVGVTVKTVYSQYHTFLDEKYFSLPNMLIATGCIIFFVSLCGFCGALKESWLIVGIFSIFLVVIFIFELSIGIAGYVLRDKTADFLQDELMKNMMKYNQSEVIIKRVWDLVQNEFQCCGVNNYVNWDQVYPNGSLPISCCPRLDGSVGVFYCTTHFNETRTKRQVSAPEVNTPATELPKAASVSPLDTSPVPSIPTTLVTEAGPGIPFSTTVPYQEGCSAKFGNYISVHASDLGAAGIVLAILQLLGIVFSFHLAKQLKNGYYSA